MARRDKHELLASLRERRTSSTLDDAEAALTAWGFEKGKRKKQHVRAWKYKHVTLTMHTPHAKHLRAGMVNTVIRQIEAAEVLQGKEGGTRGRRER